MKFIILSVLVAALMFLAGCGTPGYSATERGQMITRNWGYEFGQASDDLDHLLLLRPTSHLTVWSVE